MSTVTSDLDLFRREESKIGIQINVGKCEVISKAPFNPEGSLAGFSTSCSAYAIFLYAPLVGRGSATDGALEDVQTYAQ